MRMEEKKAKKKTIAIAIIVILALAMLGGGAYLGYTNFISQSYGMSVLGIILAVLGLILLLYLILSYNKLAASSER